MEFQQIFNVRDLLLVLFLVISGLLGRLVSIFGAGFAAKLLAPVIARIVVTPIIGDLFERDAASYLAALPIPIETTITEMAVEMAEGVAFLMLMVLFGILFSLMLSIVSQSLRFLTRYTPLGILDRLAGLALGAAGGAALLMLAAVVLSYAAPELFRGLGWLSPVNTADTLLTREYLAALIPDYAV